MRFAKDLAGHVGLRAAESSIPAAKSSPLETEVIALFDSHRNRIFRYVLAFGLSANDAEDVVQEVFLSLFRHLQLDRSRSNLRGWIFRVAHNLALKQRQAGQRLGQTVECETQLLFSSRDPSADPEQHLAFRQRQKHLLAVVRALPENDERCLRLRAEGLRYREIAEVLGISLGMVSLILSRTLARLERADLG